MRPLIHASHTRHDSFKSNQLTIAHIHTLCRALEAASTAALALHAELKEAQQALPHKQQLQQEYEEAFARVASALVRAVAPGTTTTTTTNSTTTTAPVAQEEQQQEPEGDREVVVALLERYSERLVALVARRLGAAGEGEG